MLSGRADDTSAEVGDEADGAAWGGSVRPAQQSVSDVRPNVLECVQRRYRQAGSSQDCGRSSQILLTLPARVVAGRSSGQHDADGLRSKALQKPLSGRAKVRA